MAGKKNEYALLTKAGGSVGEVVAVNRFVVIARGLEGASMNASVVFENGETGLVRSVKEDSVKILTVSCEGVPIGTMVTLQNGTLSVPVGEKMLGRTLNAMLEPIDRQGIIATKQHRPVFSVAPGFDERAILNQQLETGLSIVDTLFPIVFGQRIAIMGDAKSGKTTFITQVAINQARLGRKIVLVLIAKRRTDVNQIISRLEQAGVRDQVALVIADVFDSMMMQFLAPYAGCALAEALWQDGEDTIIMYDDFSSHAKVYREISLLLNTNPGRESYPGDMFYMHSSLLERAGKLSKNGKSLTALPVAVTPNDDISGYLSTNLISMTDGQIVFDVETMYRGIRPAVNVGLSVSRVGGRAQSHAHKVLAGKVSQVLAQSRQADQFSHFGTELSRDMKMNLQVGTLLQTIFNQAPDELFTVFEQQIMLHTAFLAQDHDDFSIPWMKSVVKEVAKADPKTDPADLARNIIQSSPTVRL
ncbi:sodium-transporting two-sector ATPase [Candidatus Saccharibacteria bacterium]|nr:sodium-transporting two-sector ATPase [Candidatus Saccharibacteria bacterium]